DEDPAGPGKSPLFRGLCLPGGVAAGLRRRGGRRGVAARRRGPGRLGRVLPQGKAGGGRVRRRRYRSRRGARQRGHAARAGRGPGAVSRAARLGRTLAALLVLALTGCGAAPAPQSSEAAPTAVPFVAGSRPESGPQETGGPSAGPQAEGTLLYIEI